MPLAAVYDVGLMTDVLLLGNDDSRSRFFVFISTGPTYCTATLAIGTWRAFVTADFSMLAGIALEDINTPRVRRIVSARDIPHVAWLRSSAQLTWLP